MCLPFAIKPPPPPVCVLVKQPWLTSERMHGYRGCSLQAAHYKALQRTSMHQMLMPMSAHTPSGMCTRAHTHTQLYPPCHHERWVHASKRSIRRDPADAHRWELQSVLGPPQHMYVCLWQQI